MMIWLKRVRVKSRSVIAALTALRMASCFVEANKTGSKVGITFMHRISVRFSWKIVVMHSPSRIASKTSSPITDILVELTMLEIMGHISANPGGTYKLS